MNKKQKQHYKFKNSAILPAPRYVIENEWETKQSKVKFYQVCRVTRDDSINDCFDISSQAFEMQMEAITDGKDTRPV